MVGWRYPPPCYALFLKEQSISFHIRMINYVNLYCILNVDQFSQAFSRLKEANKNIRCELYLHNHLFPKRNDWDPTPHVGHLQLRAYISFLSNQIKWESIFSSV